MSEKKPVSSVIILSCIILLCFGAWLISPGDITRMNFSALLKPPSSEYWLGTDRLGRDMFKMILYGGSISIFIGTAATAISSLIAVIYGTLSGLAPKWADNLLMRFTELILSIPSILLILSLQAILGNSSGIALSAVIGITSWPEMAKVVRAEVRQLHSCEYVLASRMMGAGFFHILFRHLLPSFVPGIMFMAIHNISHAIAAEATLSFVGLGLPPDVISWGSLMNMAREALLSNAWWIILPPTMLLITTLVCITNIGEYIKNTAMAVRTNLGGKVK